MSGLISDCRDTLKWFISSRLCFQCILALLLLSAELVSGQKKTAESVKEAEEYLEERGEVFLSFPVSEKNKITLLSNIISIDGSDSDFIYVYASVRGFDSIVSHNLTFRVETPPSLRIKTLQATEEFPGEWEQYPSYNEYVSFVQKLADLHPQSCRLDTIGFSINNRIILALKISDEVQKDEPEPNFFFTSTIHGDEPGGFILLLRFAEWLLSEYGTDPHITELVDQLQIWINPLSNPDAVYFMGNESISGAKRFNINNIDLNRNFPDPKDGPHPDGEEYQPETLAMMRFMESGRFTLSANLHGGAELVNYPWDTWEKFHADDDWYRFISREYADTAHKFNSLYMNDMVNGITNGYAWYTIAGGRQDYVNYFLNGREVTLELSHDKIPLPDTLVWFWECNKKSLLNYMEQTLFGITGKVTDRVTSRAIRSEIEIPGHDSFNSTVFSDSITGNFYRLIKEGSYDIKITASGYRDTIILSVPVADFSATLLDVRLTPVYSQVEEQFVHEIRFDNPFTGELVISFISDRQEDITFNLYDMSGRKVVRSHTTGSVAGENTIVVNCESLSPGLYILKINSASLSCGSIIVKAE